MGRTERRRAAKISKKAVLERKEDIIDKVSSCNVETILTCVALTGHRLYNLDGEDILMFLKHIEDLMEGINNGTASMEDYVKALKDETGIIVEGY